MAIDVIWCTHRMATTMGGRSSFEAPDTGNLRRHFRLESRVKPSQPSNYGGPHPQKGTASVVFAASLFPQGASVKACARWEFIFPKSGGIDSQARGGAADNSFVLRFPSTRSTQFQTTREALSLAVSQKEQSFGFSDLASPIAGCTGLSLELLDCRVGNVHARACGWQ